MLPGSEYDMKTTLGEINKYSQQMRLRVYYDTHGCLIPLTDFDILDVIMDVEIECVQRNMELLNVITI